MEREITDRDLEQCVSHVSLLCRCLSRFLSLLTALAISPFFLLPLCWLLSTLSSGSISFGCSLPTIVILTVQSILLAGTLWLLRSVFSEIAQKRPFSIVQANRFRNVGIITLCYVLVELIPFNPGAIRFDLGDLSFAIQLARFQPPTINVGVVLCSVTCFAISFIFRYGQMLQNVSDDTV